MDKRIKIILDCFADWSKDCHEQYIERYDNPLHKKHIQELTTKTLQSYLELNEADIFHDYGQHETAELEFYKAAREYFSYQLGYGDSFYEDGAYRINAHKTKWQKLNRAIEKADTIPELLDCSDLDFECQNIVIEILSDNEMDEFTYKDLKSTLTLLEKNEFESKFGEKVVFEKLGRLYAKRIFAKLNPVRGRPSNRNSNLDTYRAFQFLRIVKKINALLENSRLMKTTPSELCELTFGSQNLLGEYDRGSEIDWALREYFKIKNSTVRSFLNSISRGKNALINEDIEASDYS